MTDHAYGATRRCYLTPPRRDPARITGWPFRDHLPYQCGIARSQMKGRALALGFDAIEDDRTPRSGRIVCPGNCLCNCPSGRRSQATFLARNAHFKGISTDRIARNYGNRTPVFGFPSRRSRVRDPSSDWGEGWKRPETAYRLQTGHLRSWGRPRVGQRLQAVSSPGHGIRGPSVAHLPLPRPRDLSLRRRNCT